MPGGPLILGAIALGAVAIGGILLVVLLDASSVERRCLKRIQKLEPLLETSPEQVRQTCERTQKKLDRLASRQGRRGSGLASFPDGSKGLTAYAWSEVLLAVLDQEAGNRQRSQSRLKSIRTRFAKTAGQRHWILRYLVLSGTADAEAVKLLTDAWANSETETLPFPREQIEAYLRRVCAVQPGMSKDDLRQRVHWNHTIQQVCDDLSWPWLEEARAWCQLQSWRRAIRTLDSARELFTDDRQLKLLTANVLRASGNSQDALAALDELANDAGSENHILLGVAEQFLEMGQDEAAESVLSRLDMSQATAARQAELVRARSLTRRGETDLAVGLLEQSGHWQDYEGSAVLLAHLYSRRGDHQQALATLSAAIPADTRKPEYLWTLGVAHWNCEDYANAATWFTRCRDSRHRVSEAVRQLTRCHLRQGQREEAVRVLGSLQSPLAAAEAAFHRGVILFDEGRPDQAFAHFVRCQKLAQKHDHELLTRRAGRNGVACYHALARQKIDSEEYEQAATAIQRLQEYYKSDVTIRRQLTRSQAECHVRGALAHVGKGGTHDYGGAAALVERALKLRSSDRLRGLLAGLYARQNRFADAGRVYEELLSKKPHSKSARFARALCLARASGNGQFDELRQLATQRGPYAVRAALAVATHEAENGRYTDAVELLHEVLQFPESSQDHFAGHARCHVVLLTLRAGDLERARKLATRLLGGGHVDADAILGTLLAHDGDFETALPHLEAGISANGDPTTGTVILNSAYRRVAASRCRAGDYGGAAQLLQRGSARDPDPALRQYADLIKMTLETSRGNDTIDDRTLALMTRTMQSEPGMKQVLLRATTVAHQQLGRTRTLGGHYAKAHDLWERSLELCTHLRGNSKFWRQYIDEYNTGKQYVLDCDPHELESKVFQRIASLHILMVRQLLWSTTPLLADALRHWQAAKATISEQEASELFEQIVEVDHLIRHVDPKRNPQRALELLEWICENVEQKETYKTMLANLSLSTSLEALEEGRIREFHERLAVAGRANAEIRDVSQKIQSLAEETIRKIVQETAKSPVMVAVKATRPDVYRMVLLRVVVAFAMAFTQNHAIRTNRELQNAMVPLLLNQILAAVAQSLGSK